MLNNYLKIALRQLWRYRGFSLLNGAGLTIGMAACLLLVMYVRFEAGYDRYAPHYERVYRVATDETAAGEPERSAMTAAPIAPFLVEAVPDIEAASRLYAGDFEFERGDAIVQEKQVFFADSTVFDVLGLSLLQGDPASVFDEPFSIVMTPAAAARYFGDEDPVGQTIRVNGAVDARVTGILNPLPAQSHLAFQILGSMSSVEAMQGWLFDNWVSGQFYTYVRARAGTERQRLETAINETLQRRPEFAGIEASWKFALALEPVSDIYLTSDRTQQAGPTGSATQLSILSLIGVFILVLACVNFVNLSTARAMVRAREVGVRKAVGAQRSHVAAQFLMESLVLSLLSLGMAVAVVWAVLPAFSGYLGKPLMPAVGDLPWIVAVLGLLWVVVGLAAGSYPAFYLAAFKPLHVLKGEPATRRGRLRQGLVVLQFAVSVTLIVVTAIIFAQVNFLNTYDPGFRREHMIVVPFGQDAAIGSQLAAVRSALLEQPGVEALTASSESPAASMREGNWLMSVETADGTLAETAMAHLLVDDQFLDVYDIEVVAGRGFGSDFVSDSSGALIVNEAAVAQLGFLRPEEAIGRRFDAWPSGGHIVGVVRSFNFRSLRQAVQPLALRVIPDQFDVLTIRMATGDLAGTLQRIEDVWQSFGPRLPFSYQFLDDAGAAVYRSERQLGQVLAGFSLLAIVIACLGLFGLAAFSASRRTKEIGIRKVLGASAAHLVGLLTRDMLALVVVAACVAGPIAFAISDAWLGQFAYRLSGVAVYYVLAGGLALVIAALTIGGQALAVALRDPVTSLRYE
ncbi:MAG: FtsX-like permease family protein [Rhodothermales bacterium]